MAVNTGGSVIEGALHRPGFPANTAGVAGYGPFTSAGVPASGYLNNTAEKGALAIDTTNAKLYINTGTKAATVWTVVGTQA